ncbi:MAG: hypothetical protein H6509_13090 [Bryobacterales bacterium]|nr:hypothetical protein [Bryobacterales bacterium]
MRIRLTLVALLAVAAAAQTPGAAEKEAALGRLMAQQFRERQTIVRNAEAQAYVERIVGELVRLQPGDGACCTVEIYTSAEATEKPAVYPGGYLFVPVKLFRSARDEEAFVLALAHAVAHARQRDWAVREAQPGAANAPLTAMWSADGDIGSMPLGMQRELSEREQQADQAAEESALQIRTGGGEFERIREQLGLPEPR